MKRRGRTLFAASFLAPAVVVYGLFVCWPVLQAFQFSMFRWRGISENKTFVGLENFQRLVDDDVFWQALRHNLWIVGVGGAIAMTIALAISHALQGQSRFTRFLRGTYLFPHIVSMVVVAILWMFIYNPSFGLLTQSIKKLGFDDFNVTWLADQRTALPAVSAAFLWYAIGFYVMLFAAGLKSISKDVEEAAELDGAKGLRKFWKVTWPLLWSVKRVAVIHFIISALNIFALVFLMTDGGPDRKTEVMLTYLYEQAFKYSKYGYSTALAVANFIIVMALSALVMFVFRKDPTGARK